jgi:hypothetical protein
MARARDGIFIERHRRRHPSARARAGVCTTLDCIDISWSHSNHPHTDWRAFSSGDWHSPAPWTDLDEFYADVDEAAGSDDDDDDDDAGDSDDDGGASGVSDGDVEDVSGDEETASESEGSTTYEGISGDNSHDPI